MKLENKHYVWLLVGIFILRAITYPSIHNNTDELKYLEFAKQMCNGDYSYFDQEKSYHMPLYMVILCLTSPLHGYVPDVAELVTYSMGILMVIGWIIFIPEEFDKKRFIILMVANALVWVYSYQVMIDVPVAVFMSLGMLNFYLFTYNDSDKNFFWCFVFITLAILTKETALLFVPIGAAFLILYQNWDGRAWLLIAMPLLVYLIYLVATGPDESIWLLKEMLKVEENPGKLKLNLPYARYPTIVTVFAVFGVGVIAIIKTYFLDYKGNEELAKFCIFTLVLYAVWATFYLFRIPYNLPRYHITLMPFFTLMISEYTRKHDKWIYWATLVFTLAVGFAIAYYFHMEAGSIWRIFQ